MNALIKGFNCPIVLLLESDLTDISDFHAQLTDAAGGKLQEWDMDSAVIEKNTVILPVKQAESLAYPAGRALVNAEWSVGGKPKGGTQPAPVLIADYPDKSILGSDETVTEYAATISAAELPDPWDFSTDQLRSAVVVKVSGSEYDDTELRQLIAAEGSAREQADSDEAALRAAADSSEAAARAAADSTLQAYLEAETEARAEADAAKANAADVYTKTEADALLAKKSNAANVYSKTAADDRFVKKTDYASDSTDGILRDTDYLTLESAYSNSQSALKQLAEKQPLLSDADKQAIADLYQGVFTVTATRNEDGTLTADKTFAEICSAFAANHHCCLAYEGTELPLIYIGEDHAEFGTSVNGNSYLMAFSSDNTLTFVFYYSENWTELIYGESTLAEVAEAWPKCYVRYDSGGNMTEYAMPNMMTSAGDVDGYQFTTVRATNGFSYSINSSTGEWVRYQYFLAAADQLKQVAWTGSYNDLTNKPTIPTVSNDFTDTYKEEVDTLWNDYRTALTLIGGES